MNISSLSTTEPNSPPRVLIVDDEPSILEILGFYLEEGYECHTSSSGEHALMFLAEQRFDVVLSDINMDGLNGIELLSRTKDISPDTVGIVVSGDCSIDRSIEAMRGGAFDYIRKPFEKDQIHVAVERAVEHSRLLASKRRHESELEMLVEERTARLNFLAYHDELTALPNRSFLRKQLYERLETAGEPQDLAVIFISIDRYRDLADAMGQTTGDGLIVEVADRLRFLSDDSAVLARFEGGEFGALLNYSSEGSLSEMVNRIIAAFDRPVEIGKYEVLVSVSIGISRHPADAADAEALLNNAGAALSSTRNSDSSSFEYFNCEIHQKAVRRLTLENDLNHAIERSEVTLEYQPKVDFVTERISGVEVLVRWDHPELGRISPVEFIGVAEDTGLIVALGEWILSKACEQGRKWMELGFPVSVAVNLSPCQLRQKDAADRIMSVVDSSGFDPELLNLEVTEGSIIDSFGSAISILNSIRNRGVQVSIDDFGTGYSSLGYLKHLPVDYLKVDKSFIRDVTKDPNDASLVLAIINLAHDLRLRVVAEGIETEEQHRFLHLLRCDEWQGYLFSPAVPAETVEDFLKDQTAGIEGLRSSYLEFAVK